jgi:hypothetical protein
MLPLEIVESNGRRVNLKMNKGWVEIERRKRRETSRGRRERATLCVLNLLPATPCASPGLCLCGVRSQPIRTRPVLTNYLTRSLRVEGVEISHRALGAVISFHSRWRQPAHHLRRKSPSAWVVAAVECFPTPRKHCRTFSPFRGASIPGRNQRRWARASRSL